MTATITAALLAAGASILAALLSWKSARDSRNEARTALQTNRLVDAHDREVERFRVDVSDFVRALVTPGTPGEGAVMAGCALVSINPLCSDRLRNIMDKLAQMRMSPGRTAGIDEVVHDLEDEARAIIVLASDNRRAMLP